MKHTKGPWQVRALNPDLFCKACVHHMDGGYALNQESTPTGELYEAPYVDEIAGNEALLSAAPDMMEALIDALICAREDGRDDQVWYTLAVEALRKAGRNEYGDAIDSGKAEE